MPLFSEIPEDRQRQIQAALGTSFKLTPDSMVQGSMITNDWHKDKPNWVPIPQSPEDLPSLGEGSMSDFASYPYADNPEGQANSKMVQGEIDKGGSQQHRQEFGRRDPIGRELRQERKRSLLTRKKAEGYQNWREGSSERNAELAREEVEQYKSGARSARKAKKKLQKVNRR